MKLQLLFWRGSHTSCSWFSWVSSIQAEFEFGNVHFCEEGKTKELGKTFEQVYPRTENKLNPNMAPG